MNEPHPYTRGNSGLQRPIDSALGAGRQNLADVRSGGPILGLGRKPDYVLRSTPSGGGGV